MYKLIEYMCDRTQDENNSVTLVSQGNVSNVKYRGPTINTCIYRHCDFAYRIDLFVTEYYSNLKHY